MSFFLKFFIFLFISSPLYSFPVTRLLDVDEAEDIAIRNNLPLEQASLKAERDYWIYRESLGRYLPAINFSAMWKRSNELPENSFFFGKYVNVSSMTLRFDQLILSLPIYFDIGSNDWLAAASFFDYLEQLVQTIAQIRIAHFRIVASRELLGVQQDILDLYKESYEKEEIKLEVGESTSFEYTRNRLAYTNALADYYQTEETVERARDDWVRLLGILPNEALHWDVLEHDIPVEENLFIEELYSRIQNAPSEITTGLFSNNELEYWESQAFFHRPSLRRFNSEYRSADMRVKGAWGEYLPEVRVFTTLNENSPPEFFTTQRRFQETGINFTWQLFDGFGRESRINRFTKERKIAKSVEVENWYAVQLQIRDQMAIIEDSLYTMRSAEESVKLANDGIEMGKILFDEGEITAIDYRDMIQSLGRAYILFYQSRFNLISGYYNLLASIGLQHPEAGVLLLDLKKVCGSIE